MTVTCKDCQGTIETGGENIEYYSVLYYDDRKEYICWPCCRKFAEINDSKGG